MTKDHLLHTLGTDPGLLQYAKFFTSSEKTAEVTGSIFKAIVAAHDAKWARTASIVIAITSGLATCLIGKGLIILPYSPNAIWGFIGITGFGIMSYINFRRSKLESFLERFWGHAEAIYHVLTFTSQDLSIYDRCVEASVKLAKDILIEQKDRPVTNVSCPSKSEAELRSQLHKIMDAIYQAGMIRDTGLFYQIIYNKAKQELETL